jgi:hypothetical protein
MMKAESLTFGAAGSSEIAVSSHQEIDRDLNSKRMLISHQIMGIENIFSPRDGPLFDDPQGLEDSAIMDSYNKS